MALQENKNLADIPQPYSHSSGKKIIFILLFLQLLWPFLYQIWTILTVTKLLENLLRDSILALFYVADTIFYLKSLYDSKILLVNFLLDTRYFFRYKNTRSCLFTLSQIRNSKSFISSVCACLLLNSDKVLTLLFHGLLFCFCFV